MCDPIYDVMCEISSSIMKDLMSPSVLLENPTKYGLQEEEVATRSVNYFEEIVPNYSEEEFRSHFRMNRVCFNELLLKVESSSQIQNVHKKLMFTVWMLSKQESFLSAGDRFNFSKSSAHSAFCEVLDILCNLSKDYIKWPSRTQYQDISEAFSQKSGGLLSGTIGAIDGCHIKIKQPVHNPIDYYNRNNVHSIIIQAVCDHRTVFTDIYVGAPGRMHDARVFRNSSLYGKINELIPSEFHLLGDAAYPLLENLVTPFRDNGHLSAIQTRFNERLSSIRSVIERAFGFLKGRFRRLKYVDVLHPEMAVKIVVASVVLHNHIQLFNEDENAEDYVQEEISENIGVPESITTTDDERQRSHLGNRKRNHLLSFF